MKHDLLMTIPAGGAGSLLAHVALGVPAIMCVIGFVLWSLLMVAGVTAVHWAKKKDIKITTRD